MDVKKIEVEYVGGAHVLTINIKIHFRSKQRNLDFSFQSFCLLRRKKDFHYNRCRNASPCKINILIAY
jgi:hypothetical protein